MATPAEIAAAKAAVVATAAKKGATANEAQASTVKNVANKVTDPATTVKDGTTWNNGHEVLSRTANKENGLPQTGEVSSKSNKCIRSNCYSSNILINHLA